MRICLGGPPTECRLNCATPLYTDTRASLRLTRQDAIAAAHAQRAHANAEDNPVARRNVALLAARERDAKTAAESSSRSVAAATTFDDARGTLRRPRNLGGKSAASLKARASYRDQLLSKLGLSEALEEHQSAFKQIHKHLKRNPSHGVGYQRDDEDGEVEEVAGEANDIDSQEVGLRDAGNEADDFMEDADDSRGEEGRDGAGDELPPHRPWSELAVGESLMEPTGEGDDDLRHHDHYRWL